MTLKITEKAYYQYVSKVVVKMGINTSNDRNINNMSSSKNNINTKVEIKY